MPAALTELIHENQRGVTAWSKAFAATVPSGYTVVVGVFGWRSATNWDPAAGHCTDDKGGSYSLLTSIGSGNPGMGLWVRHNVTDAPQTITVTPSWGGGSGQTTGFAAILEPIAASADPKDTFSTADLLWSATQQPGSATPTQADAYAFVGITSSTDDFSALTQPSGYTAINLQATSGTTQDGGWAYKALTSTSAENPIWTVTNVGTGRNDLVIGIVKTAAAAGSTTYLLVAN